MNLFGKVMSLFLNILSRLVITFLPRSRHLLISWLQSPSAVILEPPKIKSDTVSTVSPSICHEVMRLDAMILVFWMLRFKPPFPSLLSLSSRGFLSLLHFLPCAYLRILIFLPAQSWFLSMVVQQLFAFLVFLQEMRAWSPTLPSLYPPDKIPWTGHKTYTWQKV